MFGFFEKAASKRARKTLHSALLNTQKVHLQYFGNLQEFLNKEDTEYLLKGLHPSTAYYAVLSLILYCQFIKDADISKKFRASDFTELYEYSYEIRNNFMRIPEYGNLWWPEVVNAEKWCIEYGYGKIPVSCASEWVSSCMRRRDAAFDARCKASSSVVSLLKFEPLTVFICENYSNTETSYVRLFN